MKKILILGLLTTCSANLKSQSDILCVRNSALLGGPSYCTIDVVNDTIIDRTLLPGYIASQYASSTTDTIHSIYYVSDGGKLFGVNTLTDSLVLDIMLPLSGLNKMTTIQFNACDSTIYGLITDANSNTSSNICSFRPSDSAFTTLAVANCIFHTGEEGAIDPVNNMYIFENGSTTTSFVGGYDIATDQINFNTPVTGFQFVGLSYDCVNARIIGLETRVSPAESYLSTVNTLSGALTQISASPISGNQYFAIGGAALNHTTGVYYYSSGQNTINELDSLGGFLATDTIPGNGITCIETMTSCPCPVSLTVTEPRTESVRIYPNPVHDIVNIELPTEGEAEVLLYNSIGQLVYSSQVVSKMVIFDFSCYDPGFYIFEVRSAMGSQKATLIKED